MVLFYFFIYGGLYAMQRINHEPGRSERVSSGVNMSSC